MRYAISPCNGIPEIFLAHPLNNQPEGVDHKADNAQIQQENKKFARKKRLQTSLKGKTPLKSAYICRGEMIMQISAVPLQKI